MSDLTPHSRSDLVELPSDCEPEPTCSPYLNRPLRKLHEALLDVGLRRNLNLRQTVELVTPPAADIICLAQERAVRAKRRRA